MKEFNINHYVYVKLSKKGIEELERRHKDFKELSPTIGDFSPPETDEEGWSRWQMHDLICKLGFMCQFGSEIPFETTIRFKSEDLTPTIAK